MLPTPAVTPCKHKADSCQELCSALECGPLHVKCKLFCSMHFHKLQGTVGGYCEDCGTGSAVATSTGGCKSPVQYCKDVCLAIECLNWWELAKCEVKCVANFGDVSGMFQQACKAGVCVEE
mmetsp:Transcript_72052/g.182209  ORF Transcript_72052/g.182209 Transcript_72052/m.182209 type:complete len:121 (+) Transcript_72052:1-363(+)